MKKIFFIMLATFAVLALTLPAYSSAAMVEDAVIATSLDGYEADGVGTSFPYNTEKLYAYTRITGASGTTVSHVWYHGDTKMAIVDLEVGSDNWRTFSSKRIIRVWEGDWHVDVVQRGQVIKTLRFKINPPKDPYLSE